MHNDLGDVKSPWVCGCHSYLPNYLANQQTAINVYAAVVGVSARLFDKAQTERRKRSTPLDYIWHIS